MTISRSFFCIIILYGYNMVVYLTSVLALDPSNIGVKKRFWCSTVLYEICISSSCVFLISFQLFQSFLHGWNHLLLHCAQSDNLLQLHHWRMAISSLRCCPDAQISSPRKSVISVNMWQRLVVKGHLKCKSCSFSVLV